MLNSLTNNGKLDVQKRSVRTLRQIW